LIQHLPVILVVCQIKEPSDIKTLLSINPLFIMLRYSLLLRTVRTSSSIKFTDCFLQVYLTVGVTFILPGSQHLDDVRIAGAVHYSYYSIGLYINTYILLPKASTS